MTLRPNSLYLPSTFEERGTAAPFTTPSLALARVRRDERHGLVLVMAHFADGDGSYVVPWRAIPGMGKMTVHDRALHEKIAESRATTPDAMRAAALAVATTGLAGPMAADAAREALSTEGQEIAATQGLLILALLGATGTPTASLNQIAAETEAWQHEARTLLAASGERLDLSVDEIYRRLGELATMLAPIGVVQLQQRGRLRHLLVELAEFRQSIADWGDQDLSEEAAYASFAATVADQTLDLASRLFQSIDRDVRDVQRALRHWQTLSISIRRNVDRLSWLLDGWDMIAAFWKGSLDLPAEDQQATIGQIMRVLPLVPHGEVEADDQIEEKRDQLIQRRRMRALEDWRTGEIDLELMARIEAAKAKAAAP